MKRKSRGTRYRALLILAAAALGAVLIIGPILAQESPKPCCIAGKYKGVRQATSGRCPEPATEKFTMEIVQGKKCEADIKGTIVGDSDPSQVQNFTGTVAPSATRGCCDIKGKFSGVSETTEFQGTLCRKGGKWVGSGTYKSVREGAVCSGTWKMSEV